MGRCQGNRHDVAKRNPILDLEWSLELSSWFASGIPYWTWNGFLSNNYLDVKLLDLVVETSSHGLGGEIFLPLWFS